MPPGFFATTQTQPPAIFAACRLRPDMPASAGMKDRGCGRRRLRTPLLEILRRGANVCTGVDVCTTAIGIAVGSGSRRKLGGLETKVKAAPPGCQRAERCFHERVIMSPPTAPPTPAATPPLFQSKSVLPINSTIKPTANPVAIARKNAFIKITFLASAGNSC